MKQQANISKLICFRKKNFLIFSALLFFFVSATAVSCTDKGKKEEGSEVKEEVKNAISYGVNPGGELDCPSALTVTGTVCHDAGDAIGAALKFQQDCERIYTCATATPVCTRTVAVTSTTETAAACEGTKKEYKCTAKITCRQ